MKNDFLAVQAEISVLQARLAEMEESYFNETLKYLQALPLEDLRRLTKSIFKVLKTCKAIHDLRLFSAHLLTLSGGKKTGFASNLYRNHSELSVFMAKLLKRYGKPVNGKYSLTFPV